MSLARALPRVLAHLDWSQGELARRAGWDASYVSQLCRTGAGGGRGTVATISRVTGFPPLLLALLGADEADRGGIPARDVERVITGWMRRIGKPARMPAESDTPNFTA